MFFLIVDFRDVIPVDCILKCCASFILLIHALWGLERYSWLLLDVLCWTFFVLYFLLLFGKLFLHLLEWLSFCQVFYLFNFLLFIWFDIILWTSRLWFWFFYLFLSFFYESCWVFELWIDRRVENGETTDFLNLDKWKEGALFNFMVAKSLT